MVNIPLDEGYAYDFLAILQVKYEKGVQDKSQFDFYSDVLRQQVGIGCHQTILASPEYAECVKANRVTFEGVDDAWNDKVKASYVCHRNDDRYIAKTKLQKRFFPDSKVNEKKSVTRAQ